MMQGNTAEGVGTTQDMDSFEAEFGLEANEGIDATDDGDAAVGEGDLEAAADRFLDMDEDTDNLARLDRLAEAEATDAEDAEDADDEPAEGEDADAEEADVDEEADEDADDEEEDEDEDEPVTLADTIERMEPERAQALLDALIEKHGDALQLSYRANGEDVSATLRDLRDRAAGYAGQAEVDRMKHAVQQEQQKVESLWGELEQAYQGIQQQRQVLQGYVQQDPKGFVNDVLMQHSTPEYMRQLRDQLEVTIENIERDPYAFEQGRKLNKIEQTLQQLIGGGQARQGNPQSADQPVQQQDAGVPDDFGFIPGQGYPRAYTQVAFRALSTAADAVGVDVDDVLDAWEAEGKKEPAEAVLRRMVRQRFAETDKVQAATKRRGRKRAKAKKGGVRVPQPNQSARKGQRWDEIESDLAADIRKLQESGAL